MITIVDYDVGNIASLLNIFDYIGCDAEASGDAERIANADKLVLPGVGAFDKAMESLQARNLAEPIHHAATVRRIPLLGICLGMQLLARGSEEGQLPGLGLIAADVKRIPVRPGLKVPHMGWADVMAGDGTRLFGERNRASRFYFVHSYHMQCDLEDDVAGTIDYGSRLCVAVERGNVMGVQFHPEKSHKYGMELLSRFGGQN